MSKSYECCIIGAGPAGLGAALELTKNGVRDIVIIDKNSSVGGLSRTDVFLGARFDIGPHCFFSVDEEISQIWRSVLGNDFKKHQRLTRFFYNNKYFIYPIRVLDILRSLGPVESLRIVWSFFLAQLVRKKKAVTAEDWLIQKFGHRLYDVFFKSYVEKVFGVSCKELSAEWASQRIKGVDVIEVLKYALLGKRKPIKSFFGGFEYPVLGAGQMYEALSDKVVAAGADLMLNCRVTTFNRQENSIVSVDVIDQQGRPISIKAKQFFSSIPLKHFFQKLNPPDTSQINEAVDKIKYRDHITINLLINKDPVFFDQWIYVHSPEIQIVKLSNYNNFSSKMSGGPGKTALSAGYFATQGEGLWNESDENLKRMAQEDVEKMGLISKEDVLGCWVVRETEAYPVYYHGFLEYYNLLKSRVDEFTNFYTIGRAGMHQHNNMDYAMKSGILAARNYLKLQEKPYLLWNINPDNSWKS